MWAEHQADRGQTVTVYLRGSICLSTVAPGGQRAALSQALGRITNHGLLLFLVGGIIVIVATVSLVVHHLALAVGHVGESRVLHGGGVGQSPTVKRGVCLSAKRVYSNQTSTLKRKKKAFWDEDIQQTALSMNVIHTCYYFDNHDLNIRAFFFKQLYLLSVLSFLEGLLLGFMDSAEQGQLRGAHQRIRSPQKARSGALCGDGLLVLAGRTILVDRRLGERKHLQRWIRTIPRAH